MLFSNLTPQEVNALKTTLVDDHSIKIKVHLLDMNHGFISDLSEQFLDGQVNYDRDALVTRSLSVDLLDPDGILALDSTSPVQGQTFPNRLIRVYYCVWSSNDWVEIPVFTGPMTAVSRDGEIIQVEAQGKERLALGAFWDFWNYRGDATAATVIRHAMSKTGENHFAFDAPTDRIGQDFAITRFDKAWELCQIVAAKMGMVLAYDGEGVLRLGPPSKVVKYGFTDGVTNDLRAALLSEPDVEFKSDEFFNTAYVLGGTPPGSKRTVQGWASFPSWHPLSPEALGRNGVPRYIPEVIENEGITNSRAAQRLADERLKELLIETVDVSFLSLPIPFLEPGDLVQLTYKKAAIEFRLKKFSLPLSHSGQMSVGFNMRVNRRVRRHGKR